MMRVAPSAVPALQNAVPQLSGGTLFLSVRQEWDAAQLRRAEVLDGIAREFSALEGREVSVSVRLEAASAPQALDALAGRIGDRFQYD